MKATKGFKGILGIATTTVLSLATVALAMEALTLHDDRSEIKHVYVDEENELGQGNTTIDVQYVEGHSTSEYKLNIAVEIVPGSLTEYYVTSIDTASELPVETDVFKSSPEGEQGEPANGTLLMNTGDLTAITGKLFDKDLNAIADPVGGSSSEP